MLCNKLQKTYYTCCKFGRLRGASVVALGVSIDAMRRLLDQAFNWEISQSNLYTRLKIYLRTYWR